MDNEHTFALFRETEPAGGSTPKPADGSAHGVDPHISAALAELQQARVRTMTQQEADEALAKLTSIQSVAASLMCDVAETQAATDSEADPAEVLRRAGKVSGRESKRMAKVAKQLSDMPKVKERFATGELTASHVNALANAAEKVGPEVVDSDPTLLEAADEMPPDRFGRHARKWSEKKLIEQGVDPLERQRRAREAKLWVEGDTGLGVVMAKLPRHQFELVRQAVDRHYLHLLHQDGTDGRSPDEIRTPTQRAADAVFELLTNRSALSGETIADQGRNSGQILNAARRDRSSRCGGRHQPRRGGGDHRGGPRTPTVPADTLPRHRPGRHDLRPGRPSPLAGPQPKTRQRRPTPRHSHPRRGMLRMRRTHAQMRTPPHGRMAPRPGTHRHRQPRRCLPPPPPTDRNQQPPSPPNTQRLPNPTPSRTQPTMNLAGRPRWRTKSRGDRTSWSHSPGVCADGRTPTAQRTTAPTPSQRTNQSGTSLRGIYGVGTLVAAMILAEVGNPRRYATKAKGAMANRTARLEAAPEGRPAPAEPRREPPTQPSHPHRRLRCLDELKRVAGEHGCLETADQRSDVMGTIDKAPSVSGEADRYRRNGWLHASACLTHHSGTGPMATCRWGSAATCTGSG